MNFGNVESKNKFKMTYLDNEFHQYMRLLFMTDKY